MFFARLHTEAAKEEEVEEDDEMDGYPSDEDDDDGDGSDKEMGFDGEDGDEVDSIKLQKLAAQVCTSFIHCVIISEFYGYPLDKLYYTICYISMFLLCLIMVIICLD